jgi:hypothetical protein
MTIKKSGLIPPGKTKKLIEETLTSAGTTEVHFSIDADSFLSSLFVESTSGDLDIEFFTFTEDGQEVSLFSFPTISAPTADLLLRRAGVSMSNVKAVITYTDAVSYRLDVKPLQAGELETRILGATDAQNSQLTINTGVAQVLIPASLTDRAGLIVRNNNTTGTLYVGYTIASTTLAEGFPVYPGGTYAADTSAGAVLYGVGDVAIDTRIVEVGG